MKTKFTFNLKTILIAGVLIVVLFGGGFGIFKNKLSNANQELAEQVNLKNALQDTLRITKNKLGEEVATKLTLQAAIKDLQKENNNLSRNQKNLINRIDNLKNKNNLISAALVKSEITIDSLKDLISDSTIVNKKDSTIRFIESDNDSLKYDFTIGKVLAASDKHDPTLSINKLIIPNEQFITFEFDDDDEYYQTPIKFTISNSSPFMKTINADSYTIPEINPDVVNPSFGEKLKKFFNKPAVRFIGNAIIFGGGVYVGATVL